MWLYNFGLTLYVWLIRLVAPRHPKARLWIDGRKDLYKRMAETIDPTDRIVWVHVASLGEFEQGRPIIERIRKTHPEYKILLTFFSPSGYEVRKNYQGVDYIFYLPIDTPRNARRFLDAAHPEIAIFVKYEFWLNLLRDLNRKLGLTIVLITHEMAVIKSICQRVAVMENGRVVEEGDVYDVFAHPRAAITRRFVASASALSKVDKLIEEGSALVKPAPDEKLVRLTFHKDCVGEHVISTVSREFGVDINIVLANVEVIEDNPLGGMVALLGGGEKQVAAALHYLNENHVYTEVIADGSI